MVLGLLFVLALGLDFYAWGGLTKVPRFGPVVADAAARDLSWGTVYAGGGAGLLEMTGLARGAADFAAAEFADTEAAVMANPAVALDTLRERMPLVLKLAYYGAPLLLVAFALAFWRRPRVVRTMQRR